MTAGRLALDTPADPRARHGVAKRGGPNHEKVRVKKPKKRVNEIAFRAFLAGHFCMNSAARARATYDTVELSD